MTPTEFDRLVAEAYARIPARFRKRLKNIAVMVESEPTPAQLQRSRVARGSTLLGLYEGRPLTTRSVFESFAMPDRITIFQGPHERDSRDDDDLVVAIAETLIHEVGHYFGMSEEEIEEIEEHYWRAEAEE